jgi:hypothetical protein
LDVKEKLERWRQDYNVKVFVSLAPELQTVDSLLGTTLGHFIIQEKLPGGREAPVRAFEAGGQFVKGEQL